MSDDNSFSLVNLGKLSVPADTLIKKVSGAVGGIFEPWQIERVAKANAKVDLIRAKSEIEISDLQKRAMHRFVEEEASRQENMEKITEAALPNLSDNAKPDDIDDDWVTNFYDKSRIVSDEEMQQMWSKVLSGEANRPGTFSRRTVNFLADLDKYDADLFQRICRFIVVWEGSFAPLIFNYEDAIYKDHGVNFDVLTHLDSIGLIQFTEISEYQRTKFKKKTTVSYCRQPIELTFPLDTNNNLPIGKVMLTRIGRELVSVCQATSVEGFYDYLKDYWKHYIVVENPNTEN